MSITFKANVRSIRTDGRDLSLNVTLSIFEEQDLKGLLELRNKNVEVALVELPEE